MMIRIAITVLGAIVTMGTVVVSIYAATIVKLLHQILEAIRWLNAPPPVVPKPVDTTNHPEVPEIR